MIPLCAQSSVEYEYFRDRFVASTTSRRFQKVMLRAHSSSSSDPVPAGRSSTNAMTHLDNNTQTM